MHLIILGPVARPLRIEFSGALYHVTARGDRREPIYEDDEDREGFLHVLAEVVGRFHWICHAYCHDQSLPPRGGDPGREPLEGNAPTERGYLLKRQ